MSDQQDLKKPGGEAAKQPPPAGSPPQANAQQKSVAPLQKPQEKQPAPKPSSSQKAAPKSPTPDRKSKEDAKSAPGAKPNQSGKQTEARQASSAPAQKEGEKQQKQVIGGFEIISKLGQGAMGAVFKARQLSLDRTVALKVLPPKIAQDKKFIGRFQREARASAIMNHPNIVQGIDVGHDEKSKLWYFAMEYVDGPTLKEIIEKDKILPEQRVLEIGHAMAEALVCAEQNNVVHRDIKPDNILISSRNEPKLADLGLAKKTSADDEDASLTQTGKAVGTPHYMSPEQIRGEHDEIDIRTDIYALGGTLFHLLTGRTPYSGSTAAEIMSKHLTEKTPLAHREGKDVSEATSRLLSRMMEKEKSKRVQTARELAEQFSRLQDKGATTGPRQPIRGMHTTGPRAPIRGSGTTGPRTAVRGATTGKLGPIRGITTGPQSAVSGRTGAESRRTGKTPPTAGIVGGGIAAVLVLGVLIMSLAGGDSTDGRSKKVTQKTTQNQTQNTGSKSTKKTQPDPVETKAPALQVEKPATPQPPPPDKEALARTDFENLKAFGGLAPDNHKGRIARVQAFLARHGQSEMAGQAQAILTELQAAQKKAQEKTKAEQEAFAELSAFAGLEKNDLAGRLARVEAYLKKDGLTGTAGKARKLMSRLEAAMAKKAAADAKAEKALVQASKQAYAKFAEEYLGLLRRDERDKAAEHLKKARKDAALAPVKAKLACAQKAPSWLEALDKDVQAGAVKLKEVDRFELRMRRGAPMKVGKKGAFQVSDAKGGVIYVGSKGMSMPVKVANLHPETRGKLIKMAGKADGSSRLRRAFGQLLAIGSSESAPTPKSVRDALKAAQTGGANKADVAWITELVELAEKGAAELVAENAWPPIEATAKAEKWEELQKALDAYIEAHGSTRFAGSKKGEIEAMRTKAAKALTAKDVGTLSDGLAWHFTFEKTTGNRIVDESGKGHAGMVLNGARVGPGGKEGNCLHLAGKAQVLVDKSHAFEWGNADYSLAAWVNTKQDGTIMSKAPMKGRWAKQGRCFFIRQGKLHFDSGWVGVLDSGIRVADGRWHHVALTFVNEGKHLTLYTDGQRRTDRELKLQPDPKQFVVRIGFTAPNFSRNFAGMIDDVRAYNRVLTQDEIRLLALGSERAAEIIAARSGPAGGKVDEKFIREVAKLQPEDQYKRVIEKITELNPGFQERGCSKREHKGKIWDIRIRLNGAHDISAVRALPHLTRMFIQGNKNEPFKDLTQLRGLNLKQLEIQRAPIEDLSALAGMPLDRLNLYQMPVPDLTPIKNLPLRYLSLERTNVKDLSPLKGMKLRYLNLRGTGKLDLSPLKGMPLDQLLLSWSKTTDLSPLKDVPNLRELNLDRVPVTDISALKGMKRLSRLYLGGTKVTDLSPLKGLPIDRLDLQATPVKGIGVVKDLPRLRGLYIQSTQVRDLGPLKGKQLQDLNIERTPINNISPLEGMAIRSIRLTYKPPFEKVLRSLKKVHRINNRKPEDFWNQIKNKGKRR